MKRMEIRLADSLTRPTSTGKPDTINRARGSTAVVRLKWNK